MKDAEPEVIEKLALVSQMRRELREVQPIVREAVVGETLRMVGEVTPFPEPWFRERWELLTNDMVEFNRGN